MCAAGTHCGAGAGVTGVSRTTGDVTVPPGGMKSWIGPPTSPKLFTYDVLAPVLVETAARASVRC